MNFIKKNWYFILIFILLIVRVIFVIETREKPDSEKFKVEYESFNGKVNENTQKTYRSVSIPSDNPMIYITETDIIKKIENKETFVVYFGFAGCPWCRSVIETLIEVASDYNYKEIYYLDIKDIRNVMEFKETNIVESTKGSKGYYELLEKLNEVLADYVIKDEAGNQIQTGTKRIYAPNIVTVVKGQAKELYTGISSLQLDAYMELTEAMKAETYSNFKCNIECANKEETSCPVDGC